MWSFYPSKLLISTHFITWVYQPHQRPRYSLILGRGRGVLVIDCLFLLMFPFLISKLVNLCGEQLSNRCCYNPLCIAQKNTRTAWTKTKEWKKKVRSSIADQLRSKRPQFLGRVRSGKFILPTKYFSSHHFLQKSNLNICQIKTVCWKELYCIWTLKSKLLYKYVYFKNN